MRRGFWQGGAANVSLMNSIPTGFYYDGFFQVGAASQDSGPSLIVPIIIRIGRRPVGVRKLPQTNLRNHILTHFE